MRAWVHSECCVSVWSQMLPFLVHCICYRIEKPINNSWKFWNETIHATPFESILENTLRGMEVVTIADTHTWQCARAYISKLQTLLFVIPHHTLSMAGQISQVFRAIMLVLTLPEKQKQKLNCILHQKLFGHLSITECSKNIWWHF